MIIPMCFFMNDGSVMIYWMWGYSSLGKSFFNFYGMREALWYYVYKCFPAILWTSMIGGLKMSSMYIIPDIMIYMFGAMKCANEIFPLLTKYFSQLSCDLSPLFRFVRHLGRIFHQQKRASLDKPKRIY